MRPSYIHPCPLFLPQSPFTFNPPIFLFRPAPFYIKSKSTPIMSNLDSLVLKEVRDTTEETKKLYTQMFNNIESLEKLNKHAVEVNVRCVALGRKSAKTHMKLKSKYHKYIVLAIILLIMLLLFFGPSMMKQ